MSDYIDREAFLQYMKKTARYFDVKFDIENFPTVGVAPTSQWIKCEDRLPPFTEYVLLFFESSTAVGYLREKHGSETVWDISDENGCGIDTHSKPLYWMPLPDAPEDMRE